jgi:hypothetical protein
MTKTTRLEICIGATGLLFGTIGAILLSPAVGLVALVFSSVAFGATLSRTTGDDR